ncbi:MAG: hypothetical protein F9B45_29435 [Phycisphaera sp. RhM]|nr:hypothetical protein [Phycisphaera sp. RhM]
MLVGVRWDSSPRCDAVRCGAVRCGAVRCGAVRCGAVRCGAVRCGAVRCGAVRCGAVGLVASSTTRQVLLRVRGGTRRLVHYAVDAATL